nr:hypothetical protein CPGR_03770 [Mycolicibacterium fortuitum subsp. fortuitum DSM 46621 = ATCC 6841 = JCM 6387]
MAPEPEIRVIRAERRQITRTASCSDNAPATTAAAASPIECPITAPGWTPLDLSAAASATCIAKIVGCTRSMPLTGSGSEIASVTEKPDSSAMRGSSSAMAAANAGSLARSCAPIPAHCEP